VGLFKSIRKIARKVAAPLLGGHLATGLIARVAPRAVGLKSAKALATVKTVQAGMLAIGATAVGVRTLAAHPATLAQLKSLASSQVKEVFHAPATSPSFSGSNGGVPMGVPSGVQDRPAPIRSRRKVCRNWRGRRICRI